MSEVINVKSAELFPIMKEIFENGGQSKLVVTGSSMLPFLRPVRDSVVLKGAVFSQIRKYDIVLILRDDGQYILHRVVKKKSECFYMTGDSQKWVEGPLRPDQLVARVESVCRGDREILCTDSRWRFLSFLWVFLYPFRYLIFRSYRYYVKFRTIVMGMGR